MEVNALLNDRAYFATDAYLKLFDRLRADDPVHWATSASNMSDRYSGPATETSTRSLPAETVFLDEGAVPTPRCPIDLGP